MRIHIATDHAGFEHKEALKKHFIDKGVEFVDRGAFTKEDLDDYPDFVTPCAQAVSLYADNFGIIFGGSGQGEAMCANRVPGIRAVVYYGNNKDIIKLAREHNNANILSIGARFVSIEEMIDVVDLFLATPFSQDERHLRRINKY